MSKLADVVGEDESDVSSDTLSDIDSDDSSETLADKKEQQSRRSKAKEQAEAAAKFDAEVAAAFGAVEAKADVGADGEAESAAVADVEEQEEMVAASSGSGWGSLSAGLNAASAFGGFPSGLGGLELPPLGEKEGEGGETKEGDTAEDEEAEEVVEVKRELEPGEIDWSHLIEEGDDDTPFYLKGREMMENTLEDVFEYTPFENYGMWRGNQLATDIFGNASRF